MLSQEDLFPEGAVRRDAVMSPDGTYRYALRRRWGDGPTTLFIGLNPSTADHLQDDPTLRRCISFAERWGFEGVAMGNLFALRSTDPKELEKAQDPIGPENDEWLKRLARESDTIVAAWGNGGALLDRGRRIRERFPNLVCLGQTRLGHPRHPLYVSGETEPIPLT